MEIVKTLQKTKGKKNLYVLTIDTMEGDADDSHEVEFTFKENKVDELRKYIIACEVLAKTYPNGRGGGDDYRGPYWELLNDGWYHDNMGCADSYDGYSVIYYDENSNKYDCEINYDEDMKKEIAESTAE